jgi:microcystin-dependent protein
VPIEDLETKADVKRFVENMLDQPGAVKQPAIQGLPDALARAFPTGSLVATVATSAPAGFLLCDGSAVTGDHAALRQLLLDSGSPYGASGGDPLLPDLTDGSVPIGSGGSFPLGSTGGEAEHVLDVSELAGHAHNEDSSLWGDGGTQVALGSDGPFLSGTGTDIVGDDFPHNNMPPYVAVNWMVRT